MELEILDSGAPADGEPERLSRRSWMVLSALTVVSLLAGMLLVGGTDASHPTRLTVAPFPPAPTDTAMAVPLVGLGDNLVIGYTCVAVNRPGNTMSVSFEVLNDSSFAIIVNSLGAGPPKRGIGNLRYVRSTTGGTCGRPGTQVVGGLLPQTQSQLFTLWFRRAGLCPRPAQVELPVRVTQMAGVTTRPVRRELGTLYFSNNCPPA
jgi:hypothetical protein